MGPGAKLVGTDANGNKYYERMTEQYGERARERERWPPGTRPGGRPTLSARSPLLIPHPHSHHPPPPPPPKAATGG